MRDDTIALPAMIKLAACLEQELIDSDLPGVCFHGLIPGIAATNDYCSDGSCKSDSGNGQAWVRLSDAYPYGTFPNPIDLEAGGVATCSEGIAIVLEVGILRSAPLPTGTGRLIKMPSVSAQLAATALQLADMSAMHRAIKCCMGSVEDLDYSVGNYSPMGPDGDCLGGAWMVTVAGGEIVLDEG